MPVIGCFYSITIKMHYGDNEHNPPLIHARYNGKEGIFDIETVELTRGDLPKNAARLVKEFIKQHQQRLLEMWENQDFEVLDFKE